MPPQRPEPIAETLWLLLLLAAATVLRLYQLAETPYHHDESIHAYLSYLLWEGHPYRFDPVYHGPFLYWSNALVYSLLGASDFTARLLPALTSISLVLPLWLLRQQLGAIGWKVAAAFLVLSPTFTYYGRFLAHDNYCALFTLLLLYLALAEHSRPAAWRIVVMGGVTGLFLATKAVAYIQLGIFAAFAVLVFALDTFAPAVPRRRLWQLAMQWLRLRRRHIALGLLALLVVYATLYSSFFSHWNGLVDGVFATLNYWSGQHLAPRIPGPLYYYLPRLLLHEPVFWLALPALVWVARGTRRPLDVFLAFWTVAALALYGYAQEKVPWLLLHMLLPMVLLAGRWVEHWWRRSRAQRLGGAVLALLLCWSLRETLWLNFQMAPAAPHLLTYMATTAELQRVAHQLAAADPDSGQIFLSGRATWPLAWYLRDTHATFDLPAGWEKTAAVIAADETEGERIAAAGFSADTYPLMSWWYPDLWRLFSRELPAYLGHRGALQPQGVYHFMLFRKNNKTIDNNPENPSP